MLHTARSCRKVSNCCWLYVRPSACNKSGPPTKVACTVNWRREKLWHCLSQGRKEMKKSEVKGCKGRGWCEAGLGQREGRVQQQQLTGSDVIHNVLLASLVFQETEVKKDALIGFLLYPQCWSFFKLFHPLIFVALECAWDRWKIYCPSKNAGEAGCRAVLGKEPPSSTTAVFLTTIYRHFTNEISFE